MSFVGFFNTPIVTSAGIIVGTTYDGAPQFVGNGTSIYSFSSFSTPNYGGSKYSKHNKNNNTYCASYK
jgi:hypothetical protein